MNEKLRLKTEVIFILIWLLWLPVLAGEASTMPAPSPIVLPRIKGEVVLDGFSNESAWNGIPYYSTVGLIPNAGQRPIHPTDIMLAYDDTYLYIAAEMEEPHVWATLV